VFFLFVYEISREPLNGFAPNSHGRRVWSLARRSLKVKVKVVYQDHQGQKRHAVCACVRFVFGKTSLASSFRYFSLRSVRQIIAHVKCMRSCHSVSCDNGQGILNLKRALLIGSGRHQHPVP